MEGFKDLKEKNTECKENLGNIGPSGIRDPSCFQKVFSGLPPVSPGFTQYEHGAFLYQRFFSSSQGETQKELTMITQCHLQNCDKVCLREISFSKTISIR